MSAKMESLLEQIVVRLDRIIVKEAEPAGQIVTMTFDLDDMDKKAEFNRVMKSNEAFNALYQIMQEFRKILKYNTDNKSEETVEVIEKLRDDCCEILHELNIDLDRDYH